MRVTDKELDRLLEKTENHTFNKKFEFRGAPSKRVKSVVRRRSEYEERKAERKAERDSKSPVIPAAVAASVMIAVILFGTVIGGGLRTPASAPGTDGSSGDPTVFDSEETTIQTETTAADTTVEEAETDGENKPIMYEYGVTAGLYEKDKNDPIVLSKEQYGRSKWLNKDIIKQYEINLQYYEMPDDHDYSLYDGSFFGYAKKSDEYEVEIKVKNTNKWVGDEYLLRIEADESIEILSDTIYKGVFPEVNNPEWSFDPGDYISIPLRFRFSGDGKWGDFRVYIFVRSNGNEFHGAHDHITEAEEYFSSGYSMSDKAYPSWKEQPHSPLVSAASNYYEIRFIEIKDYYFLLTSETLYGTTELYERAALYFGDVDNNGVPLFITHPDMPEYQNPCKIPMLRDTPGYKSGYVNDINRGVVHNASPGFDNKLALKGNVLKQYNINVSGYINWSINDEKIQEPDNGLRPCKDIQICLINDSDGSLIDYTYTTSTGYYSFASNTIAYEPLDLRIEARLIKNSIMMSDLNTQYLFKIIRTIYDIPVNATYIASYDFTNGTHESEIDNINRAVSAYQAIMLACDYINTVQNNISNYYVPISITMKNSGKTNYNSTGDNIDLLYNDAFDWDVCQHAFGHYIEDLFGFFESVANDDHNLVIDLMLNNNRYYAVKYAWSEGWATFFAINAQRVMNASNLNIPNVGDFCFNNEEEIVISSYSYDINIDIELLIDYQHYNTIDVGETNEATIAALLLDLVDGVSITDNDITTISDSIIWHIIIGNETNLNDGSKYLGEFMLKFHNSTELTGNQKIYSMYLLRRYELNPYNVSVTNVNFGIPLVSWTNSINNTSSIRIFDTSGNQIYYAGFIGSQTSYYISAGDWIQIKNGRSMVVLVVEGVVNSYPMSTGYYSSYINIPIS